MSDISENQDKYFSIDLSAILGSNIFRIIIFICAFGLYYAFVSPKVEPFFVEQIAKSMRARTIEPVNVLSPVFNIYASSKDYNLSSYDPKTTTISRTKFFTVDPRVIAMNKFLTDYHSPMANNAETFVVEADKYGLDWRLVASISGVESAFGNLIPAGTNNGWGWRGINRNTDGWSIFDSCESAITHITERMALGYGTDLTPFDIEPRYCPPCAANPAHAWANGVTRFMVQLQYYLDNLERM